MTIKISDMINALSKLQAKFGDVEVVARYEDSNAIHAMDRPTADNVRKCVFDSYSGDTLALNNDKSYLSDHEKELAKRPDAVRKLVL